MEGAKRICFVLQAAAEGQTSQEFQTFLAQSATELLKALTHNIDKVCPSPLRCLMSRQIRWRTSSKDTQFL